MCIRDFLLSLSTMDKCFSDGQCYSLKLRSMTLLSWYTAFPEVALKFEFIVNFIL